MAILAAAVTIGSGLTAQSAHGYDGEVDRPRITENDWDFGVNWVVTRPANGGTLTWDETNGIVSLRLTGYMYMNNLDGECGWLTVLYHDSDHQWLGNQDTEEVCPDSNRLHKYWLDHRTPVEIASADIDHVVVQIKHRLSFNTYEIVGSKTEFNS